ncbi:prephenate dehydrogenase [Solwaraspora sp. WMMD791]|uniref:prephenate dehydrogenase n=1 Tax=Solwaraspora sp. WMMD791 TaxID=3016086 RepID=UPI002499AE0B|nr:prephenate dehydrogenase [Solwaraspora sp. WMMD791]WFE28144.1 prephenate dehydrogenase [Solwaraspora sp. WMMD791]
MTELVAVPATRPASLLVVGTGLIGTSIALAARSGGLRVALADTEPAALAAAVARGAGRAAADTDPPADLAVLAVPPDRVPGVLRDAQHRRLATVWTDVASVKAPVLAGAEAAGCDLASFVPGHPMAGSERAGPAAADGRLFAGRTWALCPVKGTDPGAVDAVRGLVRLCGATPVTLSPQAHDRAVAAVSHTPHLVAAVLAAVLARVPAEDLRLAGTGVRDTTRIAAGDPELWTQILALNATEVGAVAEAVAADLCRAAAALRAGPPDLAVLAELLAAGRAGRAALTRTTPAGPQPAQARDLASR